MIRYAYTHTATEATTGYFSCEPQPRPELADALRALAGRPLDDFLRRHLISRMTGMSAKDAETAIRKAFAEGPLPAPVLALAHELVLLRPALAEPGTLFEALCDEEQAGATGEKEAETDLTAATPQPARPAETADAGADEPATSLIFLRRQRLPDREAHRLWTRAMAANIVRHQALKGPDAIGLPPLHYEHGAGEKRPGTSGAFTAPFPVGLETLHAEFAGRFTDAAPHMRPPSAETAALAEERLAALDIIAGQEMRHTASLSPVALLRPWTMRLFVRRGRHDFVLEGQATTYGRGLSVADARASCLMEMAERASAYLSIDENGIANLAGDGTLFEGPRSSLLDRGMDALDPDDYPLEAPYGDEAVLWMRGEKSGGGPLWVPVQMASLFCNPDEVALFDSLGSTGIATGRTMEEAKLAALLEIAERDAEATTPFAKSSCFTLEADDDPLIAALLTDYKARGINVQFQDLTGPTGIPVYKCFVMSMKGQIAAGHGAGLSARRAVISALTETPFAYPDGDPSGPLLRKLPVRKLGELPDYGLPTPAANLAMLEALFTRNGRPPAYADLTRTDIGFPVVRAFVPGMELAADGGDFSRVPYRLYQNYLGLFV